jgi:protein-S-isoprenylcysteine O-methyltransferase Ste14
MENLLTRSRNFIGPGSGWALTQAVLIGACIASGPLDALLQRRFQATLSGVSPSSLLGALLIVSGGLIFSKAKLDLADNFTVSPHPRPDAALVDHGTYCYVRHPMYTAASAAAFGYATYWRSSWSLGTAGLLTGFLVLKLAHEERLLTERYPSYPAYRRRTRARLIPGVY